VTGPSGLSDALAVLMVATSLYCAGRLVVSGPWHRATGRDVDVVHVVMGVAMAGMLAEVFSFGWGGLWETVFGVSAAWFGWKSIDALVRFRSQRKAISHHVGHLVTSGAMYFMFVVGSAEGAGASTAGRTGSGVSAMAGMGGESGSAGWLLAVAVVLAVILFGYANWHLRALILSDVLEPGGPVGGRVADPIPATTLSPRLALCCEIVMALTMGYMLITLL
jgi:Domain of unknown function (DUF5134)